MCGPALPDHVGESWNCWLGCSSRVLISRLLTHPDTGAAHPHLQVSRHRRHHQHADTDADSHSPTAGWFWSHMGVWISWNEEAFTAGERYVWAPS